MRAMAEYSHCDRGVCGVMSRRCTQKLTESSDEVDPGKLPLVPQREVSLDTAAFLDSEPSRKLTAVERADQKTIVERFLATCYDDLGKAPRFLDGSDMHELFGHVLPGRFGKKDPLGPSVLPVLRAYLEFLEQSAVVSQIYEIRIALEETAREFEEAVRTGAVAHHHVPLKPIVNKAAKVGRNDPCPCGSGKKFKHCCLKLST